MATLKLVGVGLLFFVLCACSVYASQPALPTSIYGVVKGSDGVVQSGVEVVAIWTTEQGNQRTQSAISLKSSQAQAQGDPSFEGYYFFSSGYINPPSGTEIRLVVDGQYVRSAYATPGEVIGPYPIVIGVAPEDQPATPPGARPGDLVESGIANEQALAPIPLPAAYKATGPYDGAGTASLPGESSVGSDSSSSSESFGGEYEGTGTKGSNELGDLSQSRKQADSTPGSAVDYNELLQYSQTELDFFATETSSSAAASSAGEVSLYGQLTDDNGNAIEGKEVTVEWTDENGVVHNITTTTLTKEEAAELGNENLAGYYKFTKQQLNATQGTQLLVKVEHDVVAQLFSAEDTRLVDLEVSLSSQRYHFSTIAPFVAWFKEKATSLLPFAFFLLGLVGLYLVYRASKKIHRTFASKKTILHQDVSVLYNQKIRNVMTSHLAAVNESTTVLDALGLMVEEGHRAIVSRVGAQVRGIVTESTIITALLNDNKPLSTKLSEIHTTPVITEVEKESISSVIDIMLAKHIRTVVIVSKGKPVGLVTGREILMMYNNFFTDHNTLTETPAIVKSVYSPDIATCCVNDILLVVYQRMKQHNAHCAVVYEKDIRYGLVDNNIKGIITMRNLIEELYKNHYQIHQLQAQQVMDTPVVMTKPGVPLIDGMKMLLNKGARQLPVQQGYQVVGVLTQAHLVNGMANLLHKYRPAKRLSLFKRVQKTFSEGKRTTPLK